MLAIRVSTASATGMGHLARCRAIREQYLGAVTWYVDAPDAVRHLGHYGDGLVAEQSPGAGSHLSEALASGHAVAALIDCRPMDFSLIGELARRYRIAVLADTSPYPSAELVINAQVNADLAEVHLAGPEYLALPAEAISWRGKAGTAGKVSERLRVLVAFGVTDSSNLTLLAARAILNNDDLSRCMAVTIAMGATAPHLNSLASLIEDQPNFEIVVGSESMWPLYARHDLAIGAPGVSQAERAFCGLATLLLSQNEMQTGLAQAWAMRRAALTSATSEAAVADALRGMMKDAGVRHRIAEAGMAMVDGKGARRIAAALASLTAGTA